MSSAASTPAATAHPASSPTATTAKRPTSKSSKGKLSNIVILRLSPALLSKFPSEKPEVKQPATSDSSPEDTKPTNPPIQETKENAAADAPTDADAAHSSSPSKSADDAGPENPESATSNGVKRKASAGEQGSGSGKASNSADTDARPRPKPAPKRRKVDAEGKGMWTAPPHLNHRLGPKANQGDINARLRALDRSGKPCQKWQRKGLQLASFTGVKWGIGGWKTTKLPEPATEDVQSDATGSSEPKREPPSSNVASEKSNTGAPVDNAAPAATETPLPSSPAPVASVSA